MKRKTKTVYTAMFDGGVNGYAWVLVDYAVLIYRLINQVINLRRDTKN